MCIDSVFRIFSMTKAIGTAAAMKLVEEGRLDLDTPVADILDDFASIQVLDGWDGEAPRLRRPASPCTVRQLATHTSGIVYDVWNADQRRYLELVGGGPVLSGRIAALQDYPMMFDPGTDWAYGPSTDWLGRVVEQVTGERIDHYLRREFFEPLDMASTDVEWSDDTADRKVAAHANTPDGFRVIGLELPSQPEFYGMGHALNSTAGDYARYCRMILRDGELEGERILAAETVEAMSANAIGDLRLPVMTSADPAMSANVDLLPGIDKTVTLGFMRNEEDVPGMRRAGSLYWAGVMNTHYWIDRASGITGVLMMQHLPFVDADAVSTLEAFERAVYSAVVS
jgi:CubicO group peptidase (beta-lactamase class C family)